MNAFNHMSRHRDSSEQKRTENMERMKSRKKKTTDKLTTAYERPVSMYCCHLLIKKKKLEIRESACLACIGFSNLCFESRWMARFYNFIFEMVFFFCSLRHVRVHSMENGIKHDEENMMRSCGQLWFNSSQKLRHCGKLSAIFDAEMSAKRLFANKIFNLKKKKTAVSFIFIAPRRK